MTVSAHRIREEVVMLAGEAGGGSGFDAIEFLLGVDEPTADELTEDASARAISEAKGFSKELQVLTPFGLDVIAFAIKAGVELGIAAERVRRGEAS